MSMLILTMYNFGLFKKVQICTTGINNLNFIYFLVIFVQKRDSCIPLTYPLAFAS